MCTLKGKDSRRHGDIAQLGERLPCTQEVAGSIPTISTKNRISNGEQRKRSGCEPRGETATHLSVRACAKAKTVERVLTRANSSAG